MRPEREGNDHAPSWKREYQQIWKSVYDLGVEPFTRKDKRAYEARKIVERGSRVSVRISNMVLLSY